LLIKYLISHLQGQQNKLIWSASAGATGIIALGSGQVGNNGYLFRSGEVDRFKPYVFNNAH
jgi:hypothetical protein